MAFRKRYLKKKSGLRKPRSKYLKNGDLKEACIQSDILTWLKTTKLMFWRSNSGIVFLKGRMISLGPVGCADISLVVPPMGTLCGLECKSARGKIRPEQVLYAATLTAEGGHYFIVRSVEDAKNAVAEALGEVTWRLLLEGSHGPWPLKPRP